MINVKKWENEFGKQLILQFENEDEININFGGNLDLYFTPSSKEYKQNYLFEIDELEDYDLYQFFNNMFKKVVKYKISEDRVDTAFKKHDKFSKRPLVKDNIINWISDDDPEEIASSVTFFKEKGKICVFFREGVHQEGMKAKSVRFRTSGSRYNKFFIPFIELYGNICNHDFTTHQYSFDEYLLRLKRGKKIY